MKPFVTAVSDYHDFENIARHFRDAGFKLKWIEIGCGWSNCWKSGMAGYHAVFYEEHQGGDALVYAKRCKEQMKF